MVIPQRARSSQSSFLKSRSSERRKSITNMYKIAILILAAAMVQDLEACCCVSREPYMTQTCLECLFGLSPNFCPPTPKCGCGCFKNIKKPLESGLCKPKCKPPKVIYFPEVEYPITGYNVNPFYYNNCFGY